MEVDFRKRFTILNELMMRKKRGNITVWNHSETYDLASCCDMWNLLAFKKLSFLFRKPIQIGKHLFIPGQQFGEIGNRKKTSAGFSFYWGEPLTFEGVYDSFLLFRRNPMATQEPYIALFYAYKIVSKDHLLTLNEVGSARIIECD